MNRLTTFLLIIICMGTVQAQGYSGGSGTLTDPYHIATAQDLIDLGNTPDDHDKHFVLTNDLDMDGFQVKPIGYYSNPFTGIFDGVDHVVSKLTINRPDQYGVGLFGYLSEGGVIKNLIVEDVSITGCCEVGGVAGTNEGGVIINSSSTGLVTGEDHVGGLIGENHGGTILKSSSLANVQGRWGVGGLVGRNISTWGVAGVIADCYAGGDVTGNHQVGGIAGQNLYSRIGGSYATGEIKAVGEYGGVGEVGGLVGWNLGEIGNCYATGTVAGQYAVGGLVGSNMARWSLEYGTHHGDVEHCFSTGTVSGISRVGALVGLGDPQSVESSFWNNETAGQKSSAGGQGLLMSEMQDTKTFTDLGWDFERPIWAIEPNDYPRLVWNEPVCSAGTIAEHVYEIDIVTAWYLGAPDDPDDTEYSLGIEVRTDHCVDKIEVITPTGKSFIIPKTYSKFVISGTTAETEREYIPQKCAFEWDFEAEFGSPEELMTFGDGTYTVIAHYTDDSKGSTEVWFGIPGTNDPIPEPAIEPAFTNVSHGETLTSPVLLQWKTCPNANFAWLDLEMDSSPYLHFTFSPEATVLDKTLDLAEGDWEADLACDILYDTKNSDGIVTRVGRSKESNYEFTVEMDKIIDDFEMYNNYSPNRPFQTWIDGYGFTTPAPGNPGNGTGAGIGHNIWDDDSPHQHLDIMEKEIVKKGYQSMPVYYEGAGSQVDRELDNENWASLGVQTLFIAIYGDEDSTGQLYVKINDSQIGNNQNRPDIASENWQVWKIDLSSVSSLDNVTKLSIGVDGAGANGVFYLDDIRLD